MLVFEKRQGVGGSTEKIQLQKLDANGGYTAATGIYDGSEELTCVLWPGEDRAQTTTLAAAWNNDADVNGDPVNGGPLGLVDIPFPLSVMSTLDATFYSGLLSLADLSQDLAEFRVEVRSGPGTGTAPKAYHTYRDLTNELPWVGKLADYLQDQSGFAEVAATARKWIDAAILKAAPARDWTWLGRPWGGGYGSLSGGGSYGSLGEAQNPDVAAALDADQLMITTATGRRFVEASVYYTLAKILRRSVGMQSPQDLLAMAADYMKQADDVLRSCTAEIDVNGDGVPEYVIPLNRFKVTRA